MNCLRKQKSCYLQLTILSVLLFLPACGYSFSGSGSSLPEQIKTVSIAAVKNGTTEPGLGPKLREAIKLRFERYGAVKIIDNEEQADAILSSEIKSLETRTKSVTGATDIELETELFITLGASLSTAYGEPLWSNEQIAASESYANISDVTVTSSSDFVQSGISSSTLNSLSSREVSRGQGAEALSELIDEAARKIYLEAVAPEF